MDVSASDSQRVRLTRAQENAVHDVLRMLHGLRERTVPLPSVHGQTMAELQANPALARDWEGFAYNRERNVVSILGGRGMGKTTVLEEVLRRIVAEAEPATVVLDPIIPESFLLGDHPIAWIAASLGPHVEDLEGRLRDASMDTLAKELRESYRRFDERVHMYLLAAVTKGAFPSETGSRMVDRQITASRAGYVLPASLVELVEILLDAQIELNAQGSDGAERRGLVLVPFDDVDLHPEQLRRILEAIPILVAHPAVAVLFTADPDILESEVMRAYGDLIVSQDQIRVLELTQDHLRKRFPSDLRVTVSSLTPRERLNFVPEGSAESLVEVLRSAQTEQSPLGPQNLADFFDMSWNFEPGSAPEPMNLQTQYAEMLPDDPRSLTQLHGMLSVHAETLGRIAEEEVQFWKSDAYRNAFYRLVKELLVFLSRKYVETQAAFREFYRFDDFERQIVIQRPDDMVFGTYLTAGYRFFDNGDAGVALTEYQVSYAGQEYSTSAASLFSFALELPLMPLAGGYTRMPPAPGQVNDRAVFRIRGGRFGWPLPNIESFLIHMTRAARWRLPLDRSYRALAGRVRFKGQEATRWRLRLLYWYISSIIEAPVVGGCAIRYVIEDDEIESDELWQELAARVCRVLQMIQQLATDASRAAMVIHGDYHQWVLRDLAWMSFEEVARDSEVQGRVEELRHAACESIGWDADTVNEGESDAQGYLVQARQELPVAEIEEIDLERLLPELVRGDEGAIAYAMYALRTDRTRSAKRSQLEALMRSFGHKVPELTESLKDEPVDLPQGQRIERVD